MWLSKVFSSFIKAFIVVIIIFGAYSAFKFYQLKSVYPRKTELMADRLVNVKDKINIVGRYIESQLNIKQIPNRKNNSLVLSTVDNKAPSDTDWLIAESMSNLLDAQPELFSQDFSHWYIRSNTSETITAQKHFDTVKAIFTEERCHVHGSCARFASKEDLKDGVVVSPVYADYVTYESVISIVTPIKKDNKIVADLGYDFILRKLKIRHFNNVKSYVEKSGKHIVTVTFDTLIFPDYKLSYRYPIDNRSDIIFDVPLFSFLDRILVMVFTSLFFILSCLFFIRTYVIDYKRKYENAEAISLYDSLTRVYNRNIMDSKIFTDAIKATYSVICFDGDHIKDINDKFGHKAGDRAIKMLADSIKDSVRDNDIIIRSGGDEFIVVVPSCHGYMAKEIAKIIQDKVQNIDFMGSEIPLSMSYGVDGSNFDGESFEQVSSRADKQLYDVKASRNEQQDDGTSSQSKQEKV
ncbi:MAG: GGDEF domain-containing protein [Vibrio sp.]